MKKIFNNLIIISFSFVSFMAPTCVMGQTKNKTKKSYDLKELALPSEVKKIPKIGGSIYYSPHIKGKVLIPVNMWGEITRSGLHFVPIDTTLIKGISLAGGPKNQADLEKVKITRKENGKFVETNFDLSAGGDVKAYTEQLKPNDIIFIEKSNYLADRSYYTSLIGVFATVLSSILLYRQVRN